MREGSRSLLLLGAIAAAFFTAGCIPAVVGGGIFVVGVGSAVLFSGCDEPASVQVWDHSSAHPICDAKVVAESEDGSVTTFSPCYQAYLGSGTWKVTASKPGLPVAIGTVTVSKERKCSRPTFHSLELTLGIDASVESAPQPAAPRAPIPPSPSPPPASSVPATPPAGSPAAPSSTVPAAAFPSEQPPPAATDVPAPPTR